jgi:hypothetical protein
MTDTTTEIDPADVVDSAFEPSDAALRAGAQRDLTRMGIREPNPEQWEGALAASRLLYIASAKNAVSR